MSLIKCPECGREVSDRAMACPQCGFPVSAIDIEKTELPIVEEPAPAVIAPETAESRTSHGVQHVELDVAAAPAEAPQKPTVVPCGNCAYPIPVGVTACPSCGIAVDEEPALPTSTPSFSMPAWLRRFVDAKWPLYANVVGIGFALWANAHFTLKYLSSSAVGRLLYLFASLAFAGLLLFGAWRRSRTAQAFLALFYGLWFGSSLWEFFLDLAGRNLFPVSVLSWLFDVAMLGVLLLGVYFAASVFRQRPSRAK